MGAETLADSIISEMKSLSEIADESESLLYAKGAIKNAFQVATNTILECMGSELGPLRSTALVVLVHGSHALVGHVGNSRVWLVRSGQVHQLTRDHTVVQEMIDEELIDAGSARGSQFGHVLTHSLGSFEHVRVDTLSLRLIPAICCCSPVMGLVMFLTQPMSSIYGSRAAKTFCVLILCSRRRPKIKRMISRY